MANNRILFTFIGQPVIPSKRPAFSETTFIRDGKPNTAMTARFGIRDGNNCMFVDGFDSPAAIINSLNDKMERVEIDWDSRFDPDVLSHTPSFRKYYVNLNDDRREFLTQFDMMNHLKEVLPEFTNDIVVSGELRITPNRKNPGGFYYSYSFNSVRAAKPDESRKFTITADLYYNKNSLDKTDVKSTGKYFLNAYTPVYISSEESVKYIPFNAAFNVACYNLSDEMHKKIYNFKTGLLDIRQSNMQHLMWEIRCINGAEEIPFDESMLTPLQKLQIEIGERTLEDFRPRRPVVGESVTEFRLFTPVLKNEVDKGLVDSGMTESEFEQNVYSPVQEEFMDSSGKISSEAQALEREASLHDSLF